MTENIGNSRTTQQLRKLLHCREGQNFLREQACWEHGMPIVAASARAKLHEVLGLASFQAGAFLLASVDGADGELRLIHLSGSSADLLPVSPMPVGTTVQTLNQLTSSACLVTIRLHMWRCSAIAHALPRFSYPAAGAVGTYRHESVQQPCRRPAVA